MNPGNSAGYPKGETTMNRTNESVTLIDRARNAGTKAQAVIGTALALSPLSAFAQVDTASIVTEIGAAKTAGMLVLGAMILAGLGFKAWKLLKRA